MNRLPPLPELLRAWLVLLIAFVAGSIATFYLASGYLALKGQFWLTVGLVPALQAIIVVFLATFRERRPGRRKLSPTEGLAHIWLALLVVNLIGDLIIGVVVFDLVDLRFEAVAQRLIVPWIQALAVIRLLGISRRSSFYGTLANLVRKQAFLALFFLADAIFLVSSWLRGIAYPTAVREAWRPAALYGGLKAIAGGGLMLGLVLTGRFERRRTSALVSILAMGLVAYGSTYFVNWLGLLPDLLFPALSPLYRWELAYVPLFVASLAVIWRVEHDCRQFSEVSAETLEIVTLIALINANVVILGLFNRPHLLPFWEQVVHTGGLLSMTALWAAACRLFEDTRPNR